MLESIFLIVFTMLLVFANIYCFFKRKYLYLFIPCMIFLPYFYGIEISESLPLLTVTRIMYIIFFVYAFVNRKRDFKSFSFKGIDKKYLLIVAYFALRIVSNLYYITTYSQALKTIFMLVTEQMLLLIGIYLLAPSKETIDNTIRAVVGTAAVFFIVGIFESISSYKIFDSLYTVQRGLLNINYIRLGLLRATTTFAMPGIYGNMCILLLPLVLYLYEVSRKKKYLIVVGLDFLAAVHSGSRSAIFFFFAIMVVYVIIVLKGKERRILFCKNAALVCVMVVGYMFIAGACSPNLKYYYIGSGKSVLNEFGFDFDLSEGAPDNVKGFGANSNGTASRSRQLSGIYYTALINPIFGLGSGAQKRGDIRYAWNGGWHRVTTYDLGIVEIFCDEGLLGLLGVCSLLLFLVLKSKRNDYYKLMVFCYLLACLSTANLYDFLMLYVIIVAFSGMDSKVANAK